MTAATLDRAPLMAPGATTAEGKAPPRPGQMLVYGYMRVPAHVPDRKVRWLEQAVIRFAESKDLYFVRFFHEFQCGSREAFDDLMAELLRSGARHVVVPSMRHLALNTLLQDTIRDRLAQDAGASVLAMRQRVAA